MRNNKLTKNQTYRAELLAVLMKASKNATVLDEFLKDLLTPNENHEIPLRWQIVKKLAEGESYEPISKEFGVAKATVTRGARELANKNGGFWRMLKK